MSNSLVPTLYQWAEVPSEQELDMSSFFDDALFRTAFVEAKKWAIPLTLAQYQLAQNNPRFAEGNESMDVFVELHADYKGNWPCIRVAFPDGWVLKLNNKKEGRRGVDLTQAWAAWVIGELALLAYWHKPSSAVISPISPADTVHAIINHREIQSQDIPFLAVGDLDGSYANFERLATKYWVIDSAGNWAGWSKTAVFMGDILADRTPEGFMILEKMHHLSEQAIKQWGQIVLLAGNHEEFMLGYLTQEFINLDDIWTTFQYHRDGYWRMDELRQFWDLNDPAQILTNMRSSPIGQQYLNLILNFQLCHRIGEKIFFHTPPTKAILQSLENVWDLDAGIGNVNTRWKSCLQELLLSPEPLKTAASEYQKLARTFLDTGNDTFSGIQSRLSYSITDLSEIADLKLHYQSNIAADDVKDYEFLKKNGITAVVYGHTSSIMSPVEGITFYAINRDGMTHA